MDCDTTVAFLVDWQAHVGLLSYLAHLQNKGVGMVTIAVFGQVAILHSSDFVAKVLGERSIR
jgi:hypothetical protein